MSRMLINSVQQGMILEESIYHPKTGYLLLKQGARLAKEHIDKIKELGITELEVSDPYTVFVDIREKMEVLLDECYRNILEKISSPYPHGNMSDAVFKSLPKVKQIMKDIVTNAAVCEVCVDMQVIDFERLVKSGAFTSGYSILLAAILGLSDEEIKNIGIAALIHEVGMCEMFQLIGQKEIDSSHRALWEQHPLYGHYMMVERDMPREVTELIASHHEKYDGSGFPKGLKGEEIPIGARIIAICADYEENISNKGYLPYEAIEYIYGNSEIAYDPLFVKLFTENIPVYPLGAVVQLSTGETGVVVNIRKNRGPRPVVQVQYNRVHKPISDGRIIDLGEEKTIFIKKVITY